MKVVGNEGVRVGLVGAGYVSTYHARALKTLPGVKIVGVSDTDLGRARDLADRFGIQQVFGSLEEMRAVRPNVIHILTPPVSHCQLAIDALNMGCHVFVEKPMAQSVEECNRMIACARERGLVLSVNHSMLFDPVMVRARDLVRRGAVGEVLTVDYFRSSDYSPYAGGPLPAPFRDGGYPYRDLGVHALYLVASLLGEIERVDAEYRATGRDPKLVFDEWRAMVMCRGGIGQVQLSWNVRPMLNELLIQGTAGTMRVDFFMQAIAVRRKLPAPKIVQLVLGSIASSMQTIWGTAASMTRFALGRLVPSPSIHYSVIRFHQALQRGDLPPVSAREGRDIVFWVEQAAERADASKRAMLKPRPSKCPAKILITGATGMLGTALLKRLCEDRQTVRVLLRKPKAALESNPDLDLCYGDLGESEAVDRAMEGIQLVYHVGAAMRGGREEFEAGTVEGTRNVIAACRKHGVARLVHVSSMSVLDHAGHRGNTPVNEDSPYEPKPDQRGFYTRTKLEAEKLVLDAAREFGLPAVILRPGQIFAPGAERVTPSGTIAIAGQWLVVGDGRRLLPLVHVEDVVDAMLLAANGDHAPGALFQIVDSGSVTQREYVAVARRSLGANCPRVQYVPEPLLYIAAAGLELVGKLLKRSVPLTRYRIRSIRPLSPCDCGRASRELGWSPRTGIRKTLGLDG